MTVKVVVKNTGVILATFEFEKLTNSLMGLITEKGFMLNDGIHSDWNPYTMEVVEVPSVICNKADECGNDACEHSEKHSEGEMTDPCDPGCSIRDDSKCVPYKETMERVVKAPSTEEERKKALEDILYQMYEGSDIGDLDLIYMMKKECIYHEVIRWILVFLDGAAREDEKDRVLNRLVYDADELSEMTKQVEKALKALEEV